MKNIDSDLIRGNIDTIILKTMIDGDKYGLDIIKEVEARSNGTYELKQPTLYSCLKRLENQELISSYWLDSDIGGRRHYYKLTEKGHETLAKKQEEWAKSKFIIDNLLSNYDYEEYRLVKKDDYEKIIEGKQFVYDEKQSPASQTQPEQAKPEAINESEDSSFESPENDEDYEHVNDESDLDEFNELESSAEQENFHETVDSDEDSFEPEPTISDRVNPLEPSAKRLYYVDNQEDSETEEVFNDEESSENNSAETNETIFDEDVEETENFDASETDEPEVEEQLVQENEQENFEEVFEENETETEQSDDRFYFSSQNSETTETETSEETNSSSKAPELADQSSFESNILAMLRKQDDEEINTYYGDQKSYVNHLNKANEELDKVSVVQDSLLDLERTSFDNQINETISEFSANIEELNNIKFDEIEETENTQEFSAENIDELIEKENPLLLDTAELEYDDEFTKELNELNRNKNNGFFNSFDNPDYDASVVKTSSKTETDEFDYNQTDSSDASFEENDDYSSTFNSFDEDEPENELFNFTFAKQSDDDDEDDSKLTEISETESNNFDIDQIISNNITSYSNHYTFGNDTNVESSSFVPKYTGDNYKQKLSNLSAYSKVSDDDEPERKINEDALNKAKDIESLKAELEQEGIKIREFKKVNSAEQPEKTYLLTNKIKFVNSLILLFGYVFILSAFYIILNNTNFKNTMNFSFTYFLYAFIPFGAYALYHMVMFLINPYKKAPAKLAPRILIFISIILTVQLLLITYCVNLQLGFYSFTQAQYNHLLWVIPTIVSFAPIVCNVVYITLFYSKNFNV